jgi:hypothetical protein
MTLPVPPDRHPGRLEKGAAGVYRRSMGPLSGAQLMLGIGKLTLTAAIPVLLIALVLHGDKLARGVVALLRRLRVLGPPAPEPPPLPDPLEKITADLCRLATAMRDAPRGVSWARHAGTLQAYDDRLAAAARALDVEQVLGELPLGMDRDLERLRVEVGVRAAGLVFGPRKRQDTP